MIFKNGLKRFKTVKQKLKYSKKANLSIQTFFFILMSILMIWIIYFGISKMVLVNNTISEQERIDTKNELKIGFEYCTDPLNKGSYKTIEIKSNKINGVCAFTDSINSSLNINLQKELKKINESGNNVALFSGTNIIDSFKIEGDYNFCLFREENGKKFKVKINC